MGGKEMKENKKSLYILSTTDKNQIDVLKKNLKRAKSLNDKKNGFKMNYIEIINMAILYLLNSLEKLEEEEI